MTHDQTPTAAITKSIESLRREVKTLRATANLLEEFYKDYEAAAKLRRAADRISDEVFRLELMMQPACEDEIEMSADASDREAVAA